MAGKRVLLHIRMDRLHNWQLQYRIKVEIRALDIPELIVDDPTLKYLTCEQLQVLKNLLDNISPHLVTTKIKMNKWILFRPCTLDILDGRHIVFVDGYMARQGGQMLPTLQNMGMRPSQDGDNDHSDNGNAGIN